MLEHVAAIARRVPVSSRRSARQRSARTRMPRDRSRGSRVVIASPLVHSLLFGEFREIPEQPPLKFVSPFTDSVTNSQERVVATLCNELVRRGHEVTLFAAAESCTSATLVPTVYQGRSHCEPPLKDFGPFWAHGLRSRCDRGLTPARPRRDKTD